VSRKRVGESANQRLERARRLPKPGPGAKVIPHLPLELLPEWLEVNDLRGKVDASWAFGGPLIVRRFRGVERAGFDRPTQSGGLLNERKSPFT